MTARSLRIVLGLALLATSILGLGTTGAQAGSPVAFPTKPLVGACHQWRWDAATRSYRGSAVSCGERHDLVTLAVPTAATSLEGLDATEIDSLAASACEPLLLRRLGRSSVLRAVSAYRFFFGHPTPTQIAAFTLKAMPDPTALQASSLERRCPTPTRYYRFTAPLRWQYGDRVLVCYARTTR